MEKKIFLRALEPEDLDFLYEMENDESLWEVGSTNVPYSRQMLLDYIATASADIYADKQVRFIIENETRERVGIIDLMNFDPRHQRAEVGIVVKKEYQGQGFARLALTHLLQYATNLLHLHQIYAIVGVRNEKTVKLLKSFGFQGDKLLKGWLRSSDGYDDAYFLQTFL